MTKRIVATVVGVLLSGSAVAGSAAILVDSRPARDSVGATMWICTYDAGGRRVTVVQEHPCEGTRQIP